MNKVLEKGMMIFIALLSIYFYYIYFPIHSTSKQHVFIYLLIIVSSFIAHKAFQYFSGENEVKVSFMKLISYFLVHLFILSCLFFGITSIGAGAGIILWLKLCLILGSTAAIWLIFYSLGSTFLDLTKKYIEISDKRVHHITAIGVGFGLCMSVIFFIGYLGAYNIIAVLFIFLLASVISYKKIFSLFGKSFSPIKKYNLYDEEDKKSLFIDEILYLCITFLLSVNFISVYRPFPIGWDDLGVYMNLPKLISAAGEIVSFGQLHMWQVYTGIGFLSGSQTFAFFLNSFAGIIASIIVYTAIKVLVPQNKKVFDFGLLGVLMILMMPMSIFQLAKDMKLDIGLLSISVASFTLLYHTLYIQKHTKNNIFYSLVLVGFLIGIAFSIKLTSLLLLLSSIALIFFRFFGLLGFIGYFFAFIGIFTFGNLWGLMNVITPELSLSLRSIFSIFCMLLGVLIVSHHAIYSKHKESITISRVFCKSMAVILGFFIALAPWGFKNISEVPNGEGLNIHRILSGYTSPFRPDFSNIYSDEELKTIEQGLEDRLSQSGTTSDEDLGRYFGYEKGINNYLKLPWNLSFQTNQSGEFTDITYVFFTLIPLVFILLRFKKTNYIWPIYGVIGFLLLYYIPGIKIPVGFLENGGLEFYNIVNPVSVLLTWLFSYISLPGGYMYVVLFFFLPFLYLFYSLDKKDEYSKIFLSVFSFFTLYVLLWNVSAFGIVWYGILMYFGFVLLILIPLASLQKSREVDYKFYSYMVLGIVGIYVLQSSIPHGLTNIRAAGYHNYKLGHVSEEIALMDYHQEYFPILFELNISEEHQKEIFIKLRKEVLQVLDGTQYYELLLPQIQAFSTASEINQILLELSRADLGSNIKNNDLIEIRQELYEQVIYPDITIKNDNKVLRVGTFMKYFVSDNNTRLYDDSLLVNFKNYMYNNDLDLVYNRLQKLGFTYLLIDLNAATIDQDPAKNLTKRYEDMLRTFSHEKIELVETDSVCLETALASYKIHNDLDNYVAMAGVNYNGTYTSNQKRELCINTIIQALRDDEILAYYPHLYPYKSRILSAEIDLNDDSALVKAIVQLMRGNGYKALFKIIQ